VKDLLPPPDEMEADAYPLANASILAFFRMSMSDSSSTIFYRILRCFTMFILFTLKNCSSLIYTTFYTIFNLRFFGWTR